jgi:hypothetical protein
MQDSQSSNAIQFGGKRPEVKKFTEEDKLDFANGHEADERNCPIPTAVDASLQPHPKPAILLQREDLNEEEDDINQVNPRQSSRN